MAENSSKSKLKRKKSSVEDFQPEICSRVTQKKSHTPVFLGDMTAEPGRSVVPAAVWWNREQLPAVEALWALTLKSALLHLQNQHWDPVPDLPEPSTERPVLEEDEQRWCDLGEEVPPFAEPSPPPTRTPSSPLRISSSEQDLPLQNKPAPDPPDPQLSSQSRKSLNIKTTSLQSFTKRHQSVGGAGGEQANRQLLQNHLRVSHRAVSVQEEAENKEGVEDEEEEVQRRVREDGAAAAAGAGGGVLQSCPMCLLVFPVGFTQMDCDGHLAQCLSEVNVDVTW